MKQSREICVCFSFEEYLDNKQLRNITFISLRKIPLLQLIFIQILIKPKRQINDESEHDNQSKNSSTAPVTRRSMNTRSVPNTAAEREEEKSWRYSSFIHSIKSSNLFLFRFSAMLSENLNRCPLFNFFLLKDTFLRTFFCFF